MKQQQILKRLNPVLACLFLAQLATGALRMSLSLAAFNILHKGGAVVLSLMIVGHLLLNGNWIKAQYLRKHSDV